LPWSNEFIGSEMDERKLISIMEAWTNTFQIWCHLKGNVPQIVDSKWLILGTPPSMNSFLSQNKIVITTVEDTWIGCPHLRRPRFTYKTEHKDVHASHLHKQTAMQAQTHANWHAHSSTHKFNKKGTVLKRKASYRFYSLPLHQLGPSMHM
jgi:hypothetical protein